MLNEPDLCDRFPRDWIVLQRGRWGTLAFSRVGADRLLTVWRGFGQAAPGILLAEADIKIMLESYVESPKGRQPDAIHSTPS